MSENWGVYITTLENKAASFFVNFEFQEQGNTQHFDTLSIVNCILNEPTESGLPSDQEADITDSMEDKFCNDFCDQNKLVYVGRCTSGGIRSFFFYHKNDVEFGPRFEKIKQDFPSYNFTLNQRSDPEWNAYFEFLCPDKWESQMEGNNQICSILMENGDNLEVARSIDHWAYFKNKEAWEKFCSFVQELNFNVVDSGKKGFWKKEFFVHFARADKPAEINNVVYPLFEKAEELSGVYDGWESGLASA